MSRKTEHALTHFYFAVPVGASLAKARAHIAKTFGHNGPAEHVRSELAFHLYRVEVDGEVSA